MKLRSVGLNKAEAESLIKADIHECSLSLIGKENSLIKSVLTNRYGDLPEKLLSGIKGLSNHREFFLRHNYRPNADTSSRVRTSSIVEESVTLIISRINSEDTSKGVIEFEKSLLPKLIHITFTSTNPKFVKNRADHKPNCLRRYIRRMEVKAIMEDLPFNISCTIIENDVPSGSFKVQISANLEMFVRDESPQEKTFSYWNDVLSRIESGNYVPVPRRLSISNTRFASVTYEPYLPASRMFGYLSSIEQVLRTLRRASYDQ